MPEPRGVEGQPGPHRHSLCPLHRHRLPLPEYRKVPLIVPLDLPAQRKLCLHRGRLRLHHWEKLQAHTLTALHRMI